MTTPNCGDCKNWSGHSCTLDTAVVKRWRLDRRARLGDPDTTTPATKCPGFVALAPTPKPTKPRPTKIPTRYRRFAPVGCTSPATAAAAVATEATRVLEPLAAEGESIADVVGRLEREVAALVRARDEAVVEATEARVKRDRAQGKVDRVIRDLNAAWVEHALVVEERDTARSERDQARRAAEEATAVLGHAHQQLGVVGVPGGLLADRIRGLAEQRNQADEERSALRSRLDVALKRIHDERGIVFVAVLLLCAVLTAAILVALDVIPTLSVA